MFTMMCSSQRGSLSSFVIMSVELSSTSSRRHWWISSIMDSCRVSTVSFSP